MTNFFIQIFNTIFYRPLLNLLILFYILVGDFGLAIILLTILIRILFYPLTTKSIKSQKILEGFQKKVQEIQAKYQEDKERQAREMMELYRKEKVNPFSGFLPLLIQFPILIALYQVFRKGLISEEMANLYSFIPQPGQINPLFFKFLDLTKPSLILAFLAGIFQFFQTEMTMSKTKKTKTQLEQFSNLIQKQTLYFIPIFTVLLLWKLPAAISLYWLVTTIFSIVQQYFIFKKLKYE
jgi:YidC/Oxa1 family membrane protein insertase